MQDLVPLLPYEHPGSDHPSDARRWIRVYDELVQMVDELVQRVRDGSPAARGVARQDIPHSELALLERQRSHMQERLEFWRGRLFELEGLDLDEDRRVVRHAGREVPLTRRELALLSHLLGQPGNRFTADRIAREAWQNPGIVAEEVRTYIVRLRRKLKEIGAPCAIVNFPRQGYALVFDS